VSTLLAVLLAVVAGFIAGWAAHRSDSNAYIASRERYWSDQLAAELRACQQELAEVEAEATRALAITAQPAAVHFHLPVMPQGGWPQGWPAIPALPVSASIDEREVA
jgi:hypothetical protein